MYSSPSESAFPRSDFRSSTGRGVPRSREGRRDRTGFRAALPGPVTLVATLALAFPAFGPIQPIQAQTPTGDEAPVFQAEDHAYRVATVVDGLQDPWSVTWLPSGEMLVTERPGRLRVVRDGMLDPEPIQGVPDVRYRGQGGLLDVRLHPDFERNRLLYLSFSKPNDDGSEGTTAVVRGRLDLEGRRLEDVEEIFEADAWSVSGSHFGSRLEFDPDGYLFVTVGDRGASPLAGPRESHPAQDPLNHQGTVNRLHDDGRVPSDNPFAGSGRGHPEVWSYGHRNPQGLAIDPATGDVWVTEHGPQGGDELNFVLPGRNYGWPVIGYGVQYGGPTIHDAREHPEMEQPLQFWAPSIATSGLLLYDGDRFPAWRGNLFAGGLAGQELHRLPIVEGEDGAYQVGRMERPPLLQGFARIRDVRQGPDGYIYLALDDRRGGGTTPIVRLEPVESP